MATTINASTSSGLVETADTSGNLELQSNGTTQLTVSSTGAYGQLKQSVVATASGSSVSFTNIPSWVKRITVEFFGLSYAAAGAGALQIGSGSLTTTGYTTYTTGLTSGATVSVAAITNGLTSFNATDATTVIVGQYVITNITGNTWVCTGQHYRAADSTAILASGSIALSGSLDRVALVATTSTFDAGSVNILYEG